MICLLFYVFHVSSFMIYGLPGPPIHQDTEVNNINNAVMTYIHAGISRIPAFPPVHHNAEINQINFAVKVEIRAFADKHAGRYH